ncbi:MAG: low molecular weight phosphotyrosine protein phosphatase [Clostridia bacterium]|nr:low molecular weight phosphotyrosine protein phosphatase [Clostridia bacterium]
MIHLLFVCHGNICRSPMAEFVMRRLLQENGLDASVLTDSCAVSEEELGNPVYPPVRELLSRKGIDTSGKRARVMTPADYASSDLILVMDTSNLRRLLRLIGGDPDHKVHRLMDFTGRPRDVADPWYTRDFETAYRDILEGCRALLPFFERKDNHTSCFKN